MFGLSFASQLFQGSAVRTWKYISRILYFSRYKSNNIGRPAMPRSRRRHHSRSRSRSRSHSHDKDRDVKRRRIDQCESPNPKRSVSCERDVNNIATKSKDQVETLVTDVNNGIITDVDITEAIKTTSPPNARKGCGLAENNRSITQPEKSDGGDVENDESKLEDSDNDCSQNETNTENETTIVSIDLADDLSSEETGSDSTKNSKNRRTPGGSECKIKSQADHQQKNQESEALEKQKLGKERGKQETEKKDSDDCSQNETSIVSVDLVGDDSSDEDEKTESDTAKNSKNLRTPRGSKSKIETQVERQQKHQEREALKKQKLDEKERRRQEKEKIKEEKLKEKHEKQEQKQKELEMKQKEKASKEEMKKLEKEQKRLEKEKKEELRKKEKEQERLRKQQEIDEKNKEKQKQEEQKLKAATAFVNFFVPKKVDGPVEVKRAEENNSSFFMPFEVKSDMKLPPARRTPLKEEEKVGLLQSIISPDVEASYLKDLKVGKTCGLSQKTWKLEDARDDDVVIIEGDLGETICEEKPKFEKMRTKFLKFHENRRPAYYGTWRKNSKCIKGRKPFVQDIEYFDYEVDSDDDWEEEEQGESLENGSEDEDKENEAENDDYEVDNDFFVPHGHLSDDEVDNEEVAKMSPESLKQKLKLLKDEFDHDMQSKTQKIKPRSIGCIWYKKDATGVDEAVNRYLQPLAIITIDRISIKERNLLQTSRRKPTQSKEFPPSLLPIFIKLLHGNTNKKKVLIDQFVSYLSNNNITIDISKSNISKYITQMAQWMKGPEVPMKNKFCWLIRDNISKKYNYDLNLPNTWET